jgi:hypothetical protein
MASVAKLPLDRIKVKLSSECSDTSVVIRCVISIKETDVILKIKASNDLSDSLYNISAYMLTFLL